MTGFFKGVTTTAHPKVVHGYYRYDYTTKQHIISQYNPFSQQDEIFIVDVDSVGEDTGLCDYDGRALYVTDIATDQDGNKYKVSKENSMGQYILADKWGIKLASLTTNYARVIKLRKE